MKHPLALGSALALLSALFYSVQTALVKVQITALPPLPVVIFIQSIVSLMLILPFIFKKGWPHAKKTLSTQRVKLHLLRTLFSLSISYLLFYAVTFIPLVNAVLLANTAPLFVPFIAYFFLAQKINHRMWLPILIGYAGVIMVLHPDVRIFSPAALLALAAGVSLACTMLIVRRLSATEATETTAFYFFIFSTLASGLISLPFWTTISLHMLLIMIAIGALYFLTQYTITTGLKYINAQLVSSLFYANIIYAVIISLLLWHTLPSLLTLAGMILIIVGGILCIQTERRAMKQRIQAINLGELCYVQKN